MKASEIYLMAAERIDGHINSHACHAIYEAAGNSLNNLPDDGFRNRKQCAEIDHFESVFKPRLNEIDRDHVPSAWSSCWRDADELFLDLGPLRTLALCFMAAISESEGN